MSWISLITTVLPIVVKAFSGGDKPQQQAADGMPKLVPKPTPFTPREIPSFREWKGTQMGMPNFNARGGTIQNTTPSLKSVNPSTVESQYWRTIFDPRKTRIT
jgi:hypothetical protein